MRAMMRFAVRQGWLAYSPFERGASLISKADETKRARVLTHDEGRPLLEACGERIVEYTRKGRFKGKTTTMHDKGDSRKHLRAEMMREGQVRAALEGMPALIDGEVWFTMDGLRRSILVESGEQPPKTMLGVRPKQINCRYEPQKQLAVDGFHTTRSVWCVPDEVMSP